MPRTVQGISAAAFSAQLMQTPARSIPQPVQLHLELCDVSPRLSFITPRLAATRRGVKPLRNRQALGSPSRLPDPTAWLG